MKTYETLAEIKAANARAGRQFFEPETMQLFRSRAGRMIVQGRFFVTSEQFYAEALRLYTVRECTSNGHIEFRSDFQQFDTMAQALNFAKTLQPSDI